MKVGDFYKNQVEDFISTLKDCLADGYVSKTNEQILKDTFRYMAGAIQEDMLNSLSEEK